MVPPRRSRSTTALLLLRQHLGLDLVDRQPPRHGLRGGAVVAGEHDDADALPAQRRERVRRRRLDRIGDRDQAGGRAVDRDEDHGRAVLAQLLGFFRQRVGRDAELGEPARIAEREAPPVDHRDRALAARRVELARVRRARGFARPPPRRSRGRADARWRARRSRRDAGARSPRCRSAGTIATTRGLPSVSVPVLSTTRVVDLLHPLQRLGVLHQHAGAGAAADADHDRHRRGEPERARAGDDQHRDGGDHRVAEARLGAEHRPGREGEQRHRDHGRHEPARHLVGEALDRRARALRRRHHLDDAGEHGVAADLVGPHHERARLVERAADHAVAGLPGHRHRLAGHHQFVDGRAAVDDRAVDRDLFARPHPQPVADRDRGERDLLVAAVRAEPPRRGGREAEQRADRPRGALAGAQLEHLAEQHQHGDDGRRLEIDRDRAVMAAERGRKDAGRERGDHAVGVGDAGAERDQREHVEVAGDQRAGAALEERPARPQHDRRRETELHQIGQRRIDPAVRADQVRAHLEHDHRRGEHEPDPEPPRHVGELGVRAGLGGRHLGLERHAADRAGARPDLADLGMHRAGVDRAGRRRRGGRRRGLEILRGVAGEFRAAAGRAEIVGLPGVLGAMLGGRRIDHHAAHRILRALRGSWRAAARYLAGSASNLARQPAQQK